MRISIPSGERGIAIWTLACQLKLSPKCARTFHSPDETTEGCMPCTLAAQKIERLAEERRLDREALTPDDHPETGFLDIMTDEEIANAAWLSPDIRGRWF